MNVLNRSSSSALQYDDTMHGNQVFMQKGVYSVLFQGFSRLADFLLPLPHSLEVYVNQCSIRQM